MMLSSTPRGKSLERMNALHARARSQQGNSNYSESDDSEDDNLPLANKGRVALITRMAITRAVQQSRHRGNVPKSQSGANSVSATRTVKTSRSNIPPGGKFLSPLSSIRKGGTSDKSNEKNKSNSKKRDNDGGLDCNEPNRTERGNDGCGVGTATMVAEINNSDFQPSHNNEPPDGVMGDKAVAEGVCMNVTTGNNSNKKRRSNRKKRDNAGGLGGNEVHAMDGGNGGVDAPVDFFGIFNDERVNGIEQCGTADNTSSMTRLLKLLPRSLQRMF